MRYHIVNMTKNDLTDDADGNGSCRGGDIDEEKEDEFNYNRINR